MIWPSIFLINENDDIKQSAQVQFPIHPSQQNQSPTKSKSKRRSWILGLAVRQFETHNMIFIKQLRLKQVIYQDISIQNAKPIELKSTGVSLFRHLNIFLFRTYQNFLHKLLIKYSGLKANNYHNLIEIGFIDSHDVLC